MPAVDTPGHPGHNERSTGSKLYGNAEQRAAGGFRSEVDATNEQQGSHIGIMGRIKEAVIDRPREKMQVGAQPLTGSLRSKNIHFA